MRHAIVRLAVSALAASIFANASHAQVPGRPAAPAPQPFRLPAAHEHVLANGLRVVVVEDHSVPIVAVRAVFTVDETFDPAGKEGLYQVTQSALREGSMQHSSEELAALSASLGTSVSPTSFTTTPKNFAGALALMSEMLSEPSFLQPAIDRRKATVAANQRNVAAAPTYAPRALFLTLVRGRDDAYARIARANGTSAAAITRDDVVQFYQHYFGPQSTTLVVAGDVSDANALAAVTKGLGAWSKSAEVVAPPSTTPPPVAPTTIYLMDAPGSQAYVYVGNLGPVRNTSDEFAAELAGTLMVNRLIQTLREQRSLVYSLSGSVAWHPAPFASELFGSTSLQTAKADSAIVAWMKILRGLRGDEPVSAAELEGARRARVGPLFARIDGPDSLANRTAESVRNRAPVDYLERYAAGMNAVTVADVIAAARRHVDIEHLAIVVTGDRKVLEPALRATKIAPVVIVDATGKPIASP